MKTLREALALFLLRQYFQQLPQELFDAARLDGAGEFRTFISIGVSLSGQVTLHSVAMPPLWTHSPIVKPSMTAPGSTNVLTTVHLPTRSRSASQVGSPFSRIRCAAASTS